jgi:methionine-rich copper-binding protein CopC
VAVTRVRLVGPNGPVALGPVQRADDTAARAAGIPRPPAGATRGDDAVAVPIRGAMPPGAYTVEWRTMAADGHPVSGRVPFRVAAPR